MRFDSPESTIPKKMAMIKTATKTTRVPERVSFLEGQVTFFSSVLTSLKNCIAASNFSFIENSIAPPNRNGLPCTLHGAWQARRDLNPHHPDLESGALSVRATGLSLLTPITSSLYGQYVCDGICSISCTQAFL